MLYPNGSRTEPPISSAFGPRGPGIGSTIHRGVDLIDIGQVRSIGGGRVVITGTPAGWSAGGVQVWVQYDTFFVRYMHLARYVVNIGDSVVEGQWLGVEDTTGTATGRHLHMEVTMGQWHFNNVGQINPIPFLRARIGASGGGSSSYSSETEQLQSDLSFIGYPTTIDGDYGDGTKANVSQFQRDAGLVDDGDAGPKTKAEIARIVTEFQGWLKALGYTITVDGKSGPQSREVAKDFQAKNGLEVDGVVGYKTREVLRAKATRPTGYNAIPDVRATADIQKLVGAPVDAAYGPDTTEYVQKWQREHGLKDDGIWGPESDKIGFPPTPAAFIPIDVDGLWPVVNSETTRALEASLGLPITGNLGVDTVKGLQAAVGVPEKDRDGDLGPQTTQYLQAAIGVRQDKQLGPETIKALQTLLNAGRKLLPGKLEEIEGPKTYPQPAAATFPLAKRWGHSPNCSPRTKKIVGFVWHHWGTKPIPTADNAWASFMQPNGRTSSPTWQINADGSIFECVPPDGFRPWTTGEVVDMQAVTVEVQNSSVDPTWSFSVNALEGVAQALAFAAQRYGFPIQKGKVDENGVFVVPGIVGHNETPAGKSTGTVCPGPSADYEWVIARAREIAKPTTPPTPTPSMVTVPVSWLADLRANELANAEEITKVIGS